MGAAIDAIDAIVLAGDRTGARAVAGSNKALLEIDGRPLVIAVLDALDSVARVRSITVVGPRDRLSCCIQQHYPEQHRSTPLEILEQADTAYQNFWAAFTHISAASNEDREGSAAPPTDTPVLLLAADMPLLSTFELDEFLDGASLDELDYCIGMTDARHLHKFRARSGLPGIRMTCLHLADGDLRLNNLHLLRPHRVGNRHLIEQIYQFRYQKNPWNIVRSAARLLQSPGLGFRAIALYTRLQVALWAEALNWTSLRRRCAAGVSRERVSQYASALLGTRAGIVETTIGGAALDVDNLVDFNTLQLRSSEFRALLADAAQNRGFTEPPE